MSEITPTNLWRSLPGKSDRFRSVWEPDAHGFPLEAVTAKVKNDDAKLALFYSNDIHGKLFPDCAKGLSLLESLRNQASNTDAGALILGGGDDHGGGSVWDVSMASDRPYSLAYRLMRSVEVDAFTLGNHDLDWGQEALVSALSDSGLRPVVTNARPDTPLWSHVTLARVFEFANTRVGILGLAHCSQVIDAHRHFTDPLTALKPWLQLLEPLVDCIVIISHLGNNQDPDKDDRALLAALPRNTLLCGAHAHQVIPETGPEWRAEQYLQSGIFAQTFGQAKWDRNRGWLIRNLPFDPSPAEVPTYFRSRLESELQMEIAKRGRVKMWPARSEAPPSAWFEDCDLNWAADALANWERERAPNPTRPILACVCSRFASSSSLDGEMDISDWYRVFPYADRIVRFSIPWERLPAWLAFNSQRLAEHDPNAKKKGFLHCNRDWSFTFDSARAAQDRLSITYQGRAYSPTDHESLTVLTHAFVASGAGGYEPFLKNCEADRRTYEVETISLRELLWETARENGPFALPPTDGKVTPSA